MFDRGKLIIIIFGAYKFLYLLPYDSNFQYFEIKSLAPWTSNLRDSTVCKIILLSLLIKRSESTEGASPFKTLKTMAMILDLRISRVVFLCFNNNRP